MPAPRVLISCTLAPIGGCETHVLNLAPLLRQAGAEVVVAAQSNELPPAARQRLADAGVQVLSTPFAWNTRWTALRQMTAAALFARELGRQAPFDTLLGVGHGGFHLFLQRFVRPGGWTYLNEVTDPASLGRGALAGLHGMRACVSVSRQVGERMRSAFGMRIPLAVLPHLSNSGGPPLPRPPGPAGDREIRLVFLGRLATDKRPGLLIDLLPQLDAGRVRIDIHGGGPLEADLRHAVETKGLQDRVTVHGTYAPSDLPRILGAADLVALPSLSEGLPQVLVEAMGHGVPFLACDAGGMRELMVENEDCLLCGTEPSEVRDGLRQLIDRVRRGEVQAERLQSLYTRRWSPATIGPQWVELLAQPDRFWLRWSQEGGLA